MANEISWRHTNTGESLYFTIRNTDRQYYNTNSAAFESLTVANWYSIDSNNYAIDLTETPSDSYFFVGDMPAISEGWYWIDIFSVLDVEVGPAIGDDFLATIIGYWNGTILSLQVSDAISISGNVSAANKLEATLDATPSGEVSDVSSSTTVFDTTLTSIVDDYYNGAFIVFYTGDLIGQSRLISDYDGTGKTITVSTAFTAAPADEDKFLILGRSE
jgi:hypothetical protein